jgi:inner membrane protein
MPSPIAHSTSGYIITELLWRNNKTIDLHKKWSVIIYAIFISNAPDLDFALSYLTDNNYHHSFIHSLTFAICISIFAGLIGCILKKRVFKQLFWLTLIIYGSHMLLDFFTEGGKGIQFLWPFTDNYFISTIPVFPGVHRSRGLFHSSHLLFISFETFYSVLLVGGMLLWKKKKKYISK